MYVCEKCNYRTHREQIWLGTSCEFTNSGVYNDQDLSVNPMNIIVIDLQQDKGECELYFGLENWWEIDTLNDNIQINCFGKEDLAYLLDKLRSFGKSGVYGFPQWRKRGEYVKRNIKQEDVKNLF